MSLIHDALKKVEGVRHGAGAQGDVSVSAAAGFGRRNRPGLLAGALIAVVIAGGVFIYLNRSHRVPAVVNTKPAPQARPAAQSAAVDEDRAGAGNSRGVELYRAGKYAEALDEFNSAIDRSVEDAVLRNNYGLVAMALGKNEEAESSFKKALELAPEYPEALNNYGALKALKSDNAGAVELYKKALSLRPDYAEAHLNLAIALEGLMRYGEALAHYKRYSKLNRTGLPEGFDRKLAQLRSMVDGKNAHRGGR